MEKISLWLADIRTMEGREEQWMPLLTEQRRRTVLASRVREDRLGSAAAGLLLRCVLTLREEPVRDEYGRPGMPSGPEFSLSHGGEYALLATSTLRVGADIEPIRGKTPVIPRKFLLPDELDWLGETPLPERFAVLWTRLESALKADGRGFAMEKRDFSVVGSGHCWQLYTLVHDGHVISCAAPAPFETELTVLTAEELLA